MRLVLLSLILAIAGCAGDPEECIVPQGTYIGTYHYIEGDCPAEYHEAVEGLESEFYVDFETECGVIQSQDENRRGDCTDSVTLAFSSDGDGLVDGMMEYRSFCSDTGECRDYYELRFQ